MVSEAPAVFEPVRVLDARGELERAWQILQTVRDPEIPVVSIVELGIVREIEMPGPRVIITPTFCGCPAAQWIAEQVVSVLKSAGYPDAVVEQTLSPAWSSSWISADGLEKLADYGIAPPNPDGDRPQQCPQCGASQVELISEFGSTPCKALYRCVVCAEPFDYFKVL